VTGYDTPPLRQEQSKHAAPSVECGNT